LDGRSAAAVATPEMGCRVPDCTSFGNSCRVASQSLTPPPGLTTLQPQPSSRATVMVSPQGDSRRRVAEGHQLASECLSAALAMVLPTLGGVWLDARWQSSPWCTLAGGVLGMTAGLQQLVRLSAGRPRSGHRSPGSRNGPPASSVGQTEPDRESAPQETQFNTPGDQARDRPA